MRVIRTRGLTGPYIPASESTNPGVRFVTPEMNAATVLGEDTRLRNAGTSNAQADLMRMLYGGGDAIEPQTGADLTPMGDVIPFMEAANMAAEGDYADAGLATAAALASLFVPYRIQGPLRGGKGATDIQPWETPFNVPAVNAAPNPYVQIVYPMNDILENELGKIQSLFPIGTTRTTKELAQEYGDDFVDYTLDRAQQNMSQSGVDQLYPDVVKQLSLLGAFDYLDDFQIDQIRMSNLNMMLGDLANNPNVRSVITPQEFPGLISGNMPLQDALDAYSRNEIQRRSDDIIFDYMRKNGMLQDTPNYTAALGRTNTQNQGYLGHVIEALTEAERAGMGQWDEIPLTSRLATNMNEVSNSLFIPAPGVRNEYGGFGNNALAKRLLDRYNEEMKTGGFSLSGTPVFRGMSSNALNESIQEAANRGVSGGLGAIPASTLGSSWSVDPFTAADFASPNVLIGQIGDGESVLLPTIFPDPRFTGEREIMRNPFINYDLFNPRPVDPREQMTYARSQGFKKGGKFKMKKKK
jgi:hypothetical protein